MSVPPPLSVVIPAYNEEAAIEAAVGSILRQTYGDFELIVLDDGSTDRTHDLLRGFSDVRIRLHQTPNRGVVEAGNTLLGLARGALVARLDADDEAVPERLERQVALMEERPDVVACGSGWSVIDPAGHVVEVTAPPTSDAAIRWRSSWRIPFPNSTLVARRDALEAVGGYDASFHAHFPYNVDFRLITRLADVGRLHALEDPLVRWHFHSDSVSATNRRCLRATAREISRQAIEDLLGPVDPRAAGAAWALMCDAKRLPRGSGVEAARLVVAAAAAFMKRRPGAARMLRTSLEERGGELRRHAGPARATSRELHAAASILDRWAVTGRIAAAPRFPALGRAWGRIRSRMPV